MGFEFFIILFLVLSVVSSIISKLQRRRQRPDTRAAQVPNRRRPLYEPEEDDVDPSEWEALPEVLRDTGSLEREFQEVRGTRRVSEEATGEEFRPVQATRPVEAPPVREAFSPVPPEPTSTPSLPGAATSREARPGRAPGKAKSRRRLDFGRTSARKAVLYREILGPPRSEEMP